MYDIRRSVAEYLVDAPRVHQLSSVYNNETKDLTTQVSQAGTNSAKRGGSIRHSDENTGCCQRLLRH